MRVAKFKWPYKLLIIIASDMLSGEYKYMHSFSNALILVSELTVTCEKSNSSFRVDCYM